MDVTTHNIKEFRKRLRAMQDKENISKRELLGVMFDLYEILITMVEDQKELVASSMMSEMFGPKVYKVDPETFDEVVKRDKETTRTKPSKSIEKIPGTGQYL